MAKGYSQKSPRVYRKPVPARCPLCDGEVLIIQVEGGRGSNEPAMYDAECKCGIKMPVGDWTGRKDAAVRSWNRHVRLGHIQPIHRLTERP